MTEEPHEKGPGGRLSVGSQRDRRDLVTKQQQQQRFQTNKYTQAVLCLVTQSCPIFATPRTVAHQSPLSTGFSSQEYWSGLPLPAPGNLSDPGTEPMSSALVGRFCPTEQSGKPNYLYTVKQIKLAIYQLLHIITTVSLIV